VTLPIVIRPSGDVWNMQLGQPDCKGDRKKKVTSLYRGKGKERKNRTL
jgi:hypothetical protein